MMKFVCKKYEGNPILTKEDIPFPAEAVYNSGAARYKDKYILLLRILQLNTISCFGVAESKDGFDFKVRKEPVMKKAESGPYALYEDRGIEDPRITKIGDTYYITYSCYSNIGFRTGLARTEDFEKFERVGIITDIDYRNTVLFPKKIGGRYARFTRPNYGGKVGTWISYSPDLIYWGDSKALMMPSSINIWENNKVGPGGPPIETKDGWLCIYHATTCTMDGQIYRLGCALLDLENPEKVIGIADQFILSPDAVHERVGYVHNVVFTCGQIPEPDGTLKIYYGGADQCMNVATAKMADLIEICKKGKRPPL
ncbi:glycoside hydrolase family 130 protein [bacterium]|jgi:predicted GH43/DUF377 family glycosyl hydrolase|nr:glycoside hydrolase family 130 protein [bacterium]